MNDVEVKDNLYFLVGDLHLMFKESYWIVGFNKSIMDQNNLGDTYELVREGNGRLTRWWNTWRQLRVISTETER